jgi:hypothetical protein
MYKDGSGKPLFFVNGSLVYNSNGYLIDELYLSYGLTYGVNSYDASGYTETCIVPNPGNCKQYYIFTAGFNDTTNNATHSCVTCYPGYRPYYALIDVSQNGGAYMPSTESGKNVTSGHPSDGTVADLWNITHSADSVYKRPSHPPLLAENVFYAATKPRASDGNSRLLFMYTNDIMLIYKITTTGVTYLHSYFTEADFTNSTGNPINFGQSANNNITEMEIYEDATNGIYKLAIGGYAQGAGGFPNGMMFANFNYTTGAFVPNSAKASNYGLVGGVNPNFIRGLEFSPNGQYVYFNTSNPSTPLLVQSYNSSTTYTILSTDANFMYSQIEMGTDSNLYIVKGAADSTGVLYKISNPNNPASASLSSVLNLTNYCMVNNIALGKVFTLPDQIDQEVYGSNFNLSNTACCLFYSVYDKQYYSAGQSNPSGWTAATQTWTSSNNPLNNSSGATATIGGELRIPAGKTITINNMTLKFSPQARLIIENGLTTGTAGGKLILNNCILTVDNRCGIIDMWPGVQVWGNPSLSQIPTNQGFLVMNSGTVIQNAYVGVLAGYDSTWLSHITSRPPYSVLPAGCGFTQANSWNNGANSTQGQGGAIIQGVSATFLNNQRHAVYLPYTLAASAGQKLQTCTFSINTALLASGVTPTHFVEMYTHTNTFPINGCSFICNYSSYNFTTTGLWTSNSAYAVDQYSPTRSTFNNFLYGIYSTDAGGSTATIWCKNSTFTSNKVSIYLGNVNNAIVENDTMKIFASSGGGNCTGLYLDNCTGYYVQDNNFTKGSGSTSNNKYGILVNNSGPYANAIFRNSFDNIYKGSQAQYRNYVATGQIANGTGLIYLCNTFSVSTITGGDIYVPAIGSSANVGGTYTGSDTASGIGNSQGNLSPTGGNRPSADNQFSHTTVGHDFYIESGHALASNYTYYSATSGACGTTTAYYPININTAKLGLVCNSSEGSTPPSCLSGNTGHRTMYVNPIKQAISDAASYKQMYDSLSALLDGGSTSGLLNLVTGNNNTQAVYNSLNNATPYLSNAVLKAYINSNYPANDISKILSACSPLSDDVNNTIAASNLSAGIKNQIAILQTEDVAKIDALNNAISNAFTARQLSLDAAIRILVRISDADTMAMANTLQKEKAMDLPARVQVETGLNIHDSAFAANALAKVKASDGNTNYVKLSTILLQNINKSTSQIMKNPSYVNQMLAFDKDSTDRLTYLKANLLLQTIGKSDYQPYIQEDVIADSTDNGKVVRYAKQSTTITLAPSLSNLYNSPNPFTESTTVKAVIVEKTQNAFIVITDMVGNEVSRYAVQQGENNININADGLNQAVMFCTLVVDGIKIKTNKMVLIK